MIKAKAMGVAWDGSRKVRDAQKRGRPVEKLARDLDYMTPQKILAYPRAYFGGRIPLDPATEPNNPTRARRFFTAKDDGITKRWRGAGVFVNPPYGPLFRPFVAKILEEAERGGTILALLPVNRTEQAYWQALMHEAGAICWVRKRIPFERRDGTVAKSNIYASAFFAFNVDVFHFGRTFQPLGLCQRVQALGPAPSS